MKNMDLEIIKLDQVVNTIKSKNGVTGDLSEYYIVKFIFDGGDYYTIWYTDVVDGFITFNNGILSFNNQIDLMKYCQNHMIELEEDITVYDIDDVILKSNDNIFEMNCESILDFWNIISDVARSLQLHFCGDTVCYNSIYEKLLCGCNLAALNSRYYRPNWTREEVDKIQHIINVGYCILQRCLIR